MEKFFVQAKDIQQLLNIPRHRYEYLSTKIGIAPQISRGDGRGHVHRYHSMDLFKFAYVHHANMIGLTPGICRDMLYMLDEVNDYFVKKRKSCSIWEPQSYPGFKEVRDFFYYYIRGSKEFLAFSRKGIKECYFLRCSRKTIDNIRNYKISVADKMRVINESLREWQQHAESYVSINQSVIRNNLIDQIKEDPNFLVE